MARIVQRACELLHTWFFPALADSAFGHRHIQSVTPIRIGLASLPELFSNVVKMRGARGGDVTIQRRRRDAQAVCDLGDADVGVGQHGLGSLDVVVGEFWRTASSAARTPRGGEA